MGLGLGLLGLSPLVFWAMTPKELEAALTGRFGRAADAATPPGAADLAQLMQRFPDR